jgi:hypothetical protein
MTHREAEEFDTAVLRTHTYVSGKIEAETIACTTTVRAAFIADIQAVYEQYGLAILPICESDGYDEVGPEYLGVGRLSDERLALLTDSVIERELVVIKEGVKVARPAPICNQRVEFVSTPPPFKFT